MEQILLAYGLPKETVAAIKMLYKTTKIKDGDTDFFDNTADVLQSDTFAPYLFIIFTQPLRSGRIWHKVNFLAEFNRF